VPTTASGKVTLPGSVQKTPLTHQQKTLHALNRLTFGPRPGDEQAVNKMGMEVWFKRQLHPENIDDSAFEARLDQFPALKLSQEELMSRYPMPQTVRQMARNHDPLPVDPVEHAIYADAIAYYDTVAGKGDDKTAVKAGEAKSNDTAAGDGMSDAMQMQGQKNVPAKVDDASAARRCPMTR
jgi:hypothetical protein